MLDCQSIHRCPHCGQDAAVQVIYGYLDALSPAQREALSGGSAVFGGHIQTNSALALVLHAHVPGSILPCTNSEKHAHQQLSRGQNPIQGDGGV